MLIRQGSSSQLAEARTSGHSMTTEPCDDPQLQPPCATGRDG
jgi:hypothetical protein